MINRPMNFSSKLPFRPWAKIILLTGVCLSLLGARAQAGLSWDKKLNEFTSQMGEDVVRTSYRFTNTGDAPISILAIHPSCGCVSTALQKFDYAPGESGEIKVVFDLGMDEFATLQKRTIQVTTSDAPKKPTTLRLVVHVPETVRANPEDVIWHRDQSQTKEVVIKSGPHIEPYKLVQTTFNDNFRVELEPEVEGQKYRLKITPLKTDAPSYAELKFNVLSPSFKRRVVCEVHMNVE